MVYEIIFHKEARKAFSKLDRSVKNKVSKVINKLEINPFIGKALVGNLSGLWRLRVDNFRIIYQIEKGKLVVYVLDIGARKNIY